MQWRLGVCLMLLTGWSVGPANADILNAGEVMRVEFTVDNNFIPFPPDVMRLNFGLINVLDAYTTRSADLYDGNTLLGHAETSSFGTHVGLLNLDPSNSWEVEGSPWNFDNPGVADFGPILDGSIDGRVDFSIETGTVDIPLNQVNLNFLLATSASVGFVVNPPPTITGVSIIPEPSSVGLLLFGGLVALRRRGR